MNEVAGICNDRARAKGPACSGTARLLAGISPLRFHSPWNPVTPGLAPHLRHLDGARGQGGRGEGSPT